MSSSEVTKVSNDGDAQPKKKDASNRPMRDLVDLGDAKAETHGSAGGALDMPITSGHY